MSIPIDEKDVHEEMNECIQVQKWMNEWMNYEFVQNYSRRLTQIASKPADNK